MRKRLWVILAVVLLLGIVAFSMLRRDPCNIHRLQVNGQPVSMASSPEKALSAMTDEPLLRDMNQLSLSCEGGRPDHKLQLYIRMAQEKDGVLIISPYATFYNFFQSKTKHPLP